MPWCEQCSRFWNPTSMDASGECPSCHRVIADVPHAPWHFKLLVGAAGIYLAWRGAQGVAWVVEKLG